jgi:ribonuclease D
MKDGFRYLDRADDLEALLGALDAADRIAVDTESDSMHSYFEKVCLIQIATPDEAFILDPLSLAGRLGVLAPVFADRRKLKVFHGSDYDIVCLKRDFGYEIRNLFDTMIAAQLLDLPRIGLADLVAESFGIVLEKKHSRTNWGKRPLSDSELEYSWLDVKYLIELAAILRERLERADLLEEAQLEFRRLEEREPTPREFDPDNYRRIRGSKGLAERDLSILRELNIMRDKQARRMDRPAFKVIANDTLLRIAKHCPRTRVELRALKGVTAYVQRRYGEEILRAVSRGLERGRPPPPRRKKPSGRRLSPAQQRRLDQLKEWRRTKAAVRGVPTMAVLPNHALLDIVKERPRDREELAAIATVGEKRARIYGEELLRILH